MSGVICKWRIVNGLYLAYQTANVFNNELNEVSILFFDIDFTFFG